MRTTIVLTRSAPGRSPRSIAGALATILLGAACRGDGGEQLIPQTHMQVPVVTSELRAGGVPPQVTARNPYAHDGNALVVGRQLYGAMNCAGCHGPSGGGGIGPPFADAEWIYGGEPENIVQSILAGRPNGMPAFGGKLPASEAWKIATYVKELAKPFEQAARGTGDSPAIGSAAGSATAARGQ